MRLRTRHTLLSLALFGATAAFAVGQAPDAAKTQPGKLPDTTKPATPKAGDAKPADTKAADTKKAPPKEDNLPNVTQQANTNTNNANNNNNNNQNDNQSSTATSTSLPAVYGDLQLFGPTFSPFLIATAPGGQRTVVRPGQAATFPLGTLFNQNVATRIVPVQVGSQIILDPQTQRPITVPVFENRLQVVGPAAIAHKGGIPVNVARGAFKIAENESPRPTDRFYYAYHYFSDVNPTLSVPGLPITDVQRHTLGFEKTLLDGDASIGFRLPFIRIGGASNIAQDSVGDLSIIFKYALYNEYIESGNGSRTGGDVLSTGLVVTAPTGGVATYGATDPRVHSTFLQPWIGGILVRGDAFLQGFSSIAVPTDSTDATYYFNSLQVGYKLYQSPQANLLTSVTPVAEVHITTPLSQRGLRNLPIGAIDVVSFTGGATFGLGRSSFLNLGLNVPVTGPKPYALEAIAQFNLYW